MARRTLTAFLWLWAVWTAGSVLSVFAGVPPIVGTVTGVLVAGLIWWDPVGKLWKPAPSAALRRRLADLDRVPDTAQGAEIRRETESARG